jgi:hypothetical protein
MFDYDRAGLVEDNRGRLQQINVDLGILTYWGAIQPFRSIATISSQDGKPRTEGSSFHVLSLKETTSWAKARRHRPHTVALGSSDRSETAWDM